MRPHTTLFTACSLALSAAAGTTSVDATTKNANHIFNVIHDSMRQWGSSLHHNGVSFFLAVVPAGTQLYHGTSLSTPVNGTEWLAFEPEHSLVFARPHRGPPPRRPDEGEGGDGSWEGRHEDLRRDRHDRRDDQSSKDEDAKGYLHTYAAAKHLRLLYIDGMSAAKTDKGTLDSQDALLFDNTIDMNQAGKPGGPPGERERAIRACEMAQDDFAGRIDGILRMEAGFEIILCDFERDLVNVEIVEVASHESGNDRDGNGRKGPGGPGGPGGPDSSGWARAVASRYTGIGGGRVNLNYEHFVTAFSYDLDLFPEGSVHPRLNHLDQSDLQRIRKDITSTLLTHDPREFSWNWQATTDMIVLRYSDELSYLSSDKIETTEQLSKHINKLMAPFTDFRERNASAEADKCSSQFIPHTLKDVRDIAALAVHEVAHRVCSTLIEAAAEQDLVSAQKGIKSLMAYLDWTTWKECRGCQDNEICAVPIWPMGSIEDYEQPQCRDASNPYGNGGESYWGREPRH
ncbi:hypothetical protein N7456_000136 [Penicillium angulare]|uniref:Uncharacterized protein n=1 Tax=Penicillium angulare TaxID=116970 RepID=A0A9W9KRM1_9EURO|nr:hypothetical protein N7456_000136 [Penicillium angulare]